MNTSSYLSKGECTTQTKVCHSSHQAIWVLGFCELVCVYMCMCVCMPYVWWDRASNLSLKNFRLIGLAVQIRTRLACAAALLT